MSVSSRLDSEHQRESKLVPPVMTPLSITRISRTRPMCNKEGLWHTGRCPEEPRQLFVCRAGDVHGAGQDNGTSEAVNESKVVRDSGGPGWCMSRCRSIME